MFPSPLGFSDLPSALGRADEGNLRELIWCTFGLDDIKASIKKARVINLREFRQGYLKIYGWNTFFWNYNLGWAYGGNFYPLLFMTLKSSHQDLSNKLFVTSKKMKPRIHQFTNLKGCKMSVKACKMKKQGLKWLLK